MLALCGALLSSPVAAASGNAAPADRAAAPAPVTTAEIPDASGASDHPFRLGNIGKPAFFGLIAAAFLFFAALASAHEKKKPSRRPPV